MPSFIKFDGLDGPIRYDGINGWFELLSAQVTDQVDENSGKRTGGGEVIVHMPGDPAFRNFIQALAGPITEVTIVHLGGKKDETPQEFARIILSGARVSRYYISASGDTIAFTVPKIGYKKGSPANASRMVRPDDWGVIRSADHYGQSGDCAAC